MVDGIVSILLFLHSLGFAVLISRAKALNRTAWPTAIGLSVSNVGIAVFW
ncbi:MAG: hypothetical protein ACOC2N_02725 [Spirochaetota bacterium]